MTPQRKRSWETALGNSEPDPARTSNDSARNAGYHSSSTQLFAPFSCGDEIKRDAPQVVFPVGGKFHLSDASDDIDSPEGGEHSLAASTERTHLIQDADQHTKVSRETSCGTPSNITSNSYSFSTPQSTEEDERSASASSTTIVCYGQVTNASAKLFSISPRPSPQDDPKDPSYTIRVRSDGVTLCDTNAQEVAELDKQHAQILKTIKTQVPSLRCEAFLGVQGEAAVGTAKKRSPMVLLCDVNLYGPAHDAELVGARLGEANIFLQEPCLLSSSVLYCNPHVYSTTEDLCTPFFTKQQSEKGQRFDQEINSILCQTHDYELDSKFEQDSRIKSNLQPHQIAALNFMLDREGENWQSLPATLWEQDDYTNQSMHAFLFVHKLTRDRQESPPNECRGGLLADEMGLGKSLSLLALIVHTLEEARRFTTASDATCADQLPRMGATLIVTPYSTLRNWQDEISKHIHAGVLRVHIHHGQTKSLLRSKLEAAQIVLTTYETIAFGSRSTFGHLGQFSWFRIVLDEAHWVRNPSTQVFRALYEFEAQKRWCMTGTPVHNGLNDLCALTRWLKFYPFDTSHRFRKYITRPLYKLDEEGLINLRQMMKVFQIRRVKTEMKLSRVTPHLVTVSLPNQERRQYEQIKSALLMQLAELSKTKSSRSSIATLQGIRELRRMCCDGLALQAPYENHAAYISATSPEMSCNNCSQKVDERVLRSIFHGQCGHVFCKACYTSSSIGSPEQEATESPAVSCPICGSADEANCFLDGTLESVRKDLVLGVPHSPEPSIGNFVSAKITTVVSKLAELHQESAENSCKSLVFSYWKNALISLESNLQFHKIPCVRIDGDRSADERIKALAAFRTDPSIRVMLLTFGTGSVGLTLTEATHVHLVEPHWNPMVEEQAIARAHRIGQDKPVSVWRYVVENSIEENIVRKQQRKLYFAKLTHASKPAQPGKADSNGGHGKQDDENLEHLLEDCSLFQG